MKHFNKTLLLVSLISCQVIGSVADYRSFFDGTIDLSIIHRKIYDRTCFISSENESCAVLFNIRVASYTKKLSLYNAKDLFVEIALAGKNSNSTLQAIYVADVYTEQVINGSVYGGEAFDQSNMAINYPELPQVSKTVPYRYHIGLDGCDTTGCNYFRTDKSAPNQPTGEQINTEIQLYLKINESFIYQEYIYFGLAFQEKGNNTNNFEILTNGAQAKTSSTPGYEFILVVLGLLLGTTVIIYFRKRNKKLKF